MKTFILKPARLQDLDDNCLPFQISKTEDPKINFEYFWSVFNDFTNEKDSGIERAIELLNN